MLNFFYTSVVMADLVPKHVGDFLKGQCIISVLDDHEHSVIKVILFRPAQRPQHKEGHDTGFDAEEFIYNKINKKDNIREHKKLGLVVVRELRESVGRGMGHLYRPSPHLHTDALHPSSVSCTYNTKTRKPLR